MESIIRNVKDIEPSQRRLYESLVGHELTENQQLIIQVITVPEETASEEAPPQSAQGALPDYCNVYDGLSDEQIAELESLILDRSPSRSNS